MPSSVSNPPTANPRPTSRPLGWAEICIGLATPPIVLAAIVTPVMGRSLQQISRWSDDLLRGERLPLLPFPFPPPTPKA
jgi:hypothetical protein